jgi:uncharacterized protein
MTNTKGNNKKIYAVQGMHCASCEVLINKEISKLPSIEKLHVSLADNTLTVFPKSEHYPEIAEMNKLIKEYGYSIHDYKHSIKSTAKDYVKTFFAFGAFVILFVIVEKSGLLNKVSVSTSSSPMVYFAFGIIAGLSSCAALVGGMLLSMSSKWNALYNGNSTKSPLPFVYFNVSRLITFAVLGGLLGLLGSYIKISLTFSTILSAAVALVMFIVGLQMLNVPWFRKLQLKWPVKSRSFAETEVQGKYMPIVVGALTFFVPCGFTLIAQTNALASGSLLKGATILTLFALGTLPVLAIISFSSIKLYANPTFAKNFNLFSGLLIVFFALYTLNAQLNVLGWPSLDDLKLPNKSATSSIASSPNPPEELPAMQALQIVAQGLTYSPSSATLKAGVKTYFQIYNNGAQGCAQALFARGLYPEVIYLQPGLNTVEFTPTKKGTYKISCTMGMVKPVTVKVI